MLIYPNCKLYFQFSLKVICPVFALNCPIQLMCRGVSQEPNQKKIRAQVKAHIMFLGFFFLFFNVNIYVVSLLYRTSCMVKMLILH